MPYFAYHWLGTNNSTLSKNPDIIVLLGGSGMPSPDGLMRSFCAVDAAKKYIDSKIIIAHPYSKSDSLYQLKLMAKELVVKGIDSSRIQYEPLGFNTRSQAMNVAKKYACNKSKLSVLIITSPEHMYRAIKTFIKAGFCNVGGIAAFEHPIDEENIEDNENTDDIRMKNLSLRYNMWSNLHYELLSLRECCAIFYYKIKGWI